MQGISKHLLVLEQKLTIDTSFYPTVTLGLKRTGNYHFDKPSKQTVTQVLRSYKTYCLQTQTRFVYYYKAYKDAARMERISENHDIVT